MESALKQRLVGALVLIALAVIFLPMLVHGPAPESGVADVPLHVPDAPGGNYETRELPLAAPGATPDGGALGMQETPAAVADAPSPDAAIAPDAGTPPTSETPEAMFPAVTAGGDYAVEFGSYRTAADAQRVVGALQASQLPGYRKEVVVAGTPRHRVLIGPYASRATAEAARLRAAHVRDDVGARVIALDAGGERPVAAAPAAKPPSAAADTPPVKPAPPVAATPSPPVTTPPPAAADVGFAVQLGAFRNAEEAQALRARVQAGGASAFVEQVATAQGTLHRVRVGPVFGRAEADRLRAQLQAKHGIDGLVRPHP